MALRCAEDDAMHSSKSGLYLYLLLASLLPPVYGEGAAPAPPSAALASGPEEKNHAMRTGRAGSGGCVGGAVIGTVVPIFGNLVGCAVGGLAGWRVGREKQTVIADRRPAPALLLAPFSDPHGRPRRMNISTRITEYSITGGLLWVNIFLLATMLNLPLDRLDWRGASLVWSAWIDTLAPLKSIELALPSAQQNSLGTLLCSLVIIVIFISGILLELIGPVFFVPL